LEGRTGLEGVTGLDGPPDVGRATGLAGRTEVRDLSPDRLDRPFSDPLVERLFPPLATGVHWDLDRTRRALAALGDPHRSYSTLHVGGTNGKGSVTSTLGSVLRTSGLRTACYTSPHLCSFRERLLIDGRPLAEEDIVGYAQDILDPVLSFGLTFFEAITLLAMYAFAREGAEAAVMEVGLGGRLDATNVVMPEVAAVTNVAMDHTEYLGDTRAQIAREKAGIMKPGVPFVTAENSPELLELFRRLAAETGAPFSRVDPDGLEAVQVTSRATSFEFETSTWGRLHLRTPLVGRHQATNAALAVSVLEQLGDRLRPSAAEIVEGVASVVYHGRDEIREVEGCTWLFDVAHNTAGIRSLVDTIDRLDLPSPLVAVIGVLGDKDWRSMLPELLSRTDEAILTQPPSAPEDRRWDPAVAAEQVDASTVVHVVDDFVEAMARAKGKASGGTVVVTGSVHTVGSAMSMLGLDPLEG
jgi:dihydrofolate synthase / folylpolyglutamate synthase